MATQAGRDMPAAWATRREPVATAPAAWPAPESVTPGCRRATSPTTGTTSSLPVTPGGSQSAVEAGMATVPSGDLPGPHRTTQPLGPDGTPTPSAPRGTSPRRATTRSPGASDERAVHATRDDLPDPSLRSVGEVLGDITSDLSTLLRQEIELAKAELRETADHAKAAGTMFAGAGVAGHLALIFLSLALWWALGDAHRQPGLVGAHRRPALGRRRRRHGRHGAHEDAQGDARRAAHRRHGQGHP